MNLVICRSSKLLLLAFKFSLSRKSENDKFLWHDLQKMTSLLRHMENIFEVFDTIYNHASFILLAQGYFQWGDPKIPNKPKIKAIQNRVKNSLIYFGKVALIISYHRCKLYF